ncbi:XRE family transcriptional regulator [Opitutaceae bacterium TAV4]|nr:XRE family transcriptional regulator [Opitutaceae bacterium TAV4]RRK00027.1 XRE family transcriptional regulator [Opitutaceae bacterium TAV3]
MRKHPEPTLLRFGENVRRTREALSWTQEVLAEKSGLDQTFISGIERGSRNPTVLTVTRIAAALGITVSRLCKEIER